MVNRCPVSVSTLECECNVKAAHSNIWSRSRGWPVCDAPWLTRSTARTCLGSFDPSESMYPGQDISQMIHWLHFSGRQITAGKCVITRNWYDTMVLRVMSPWPAHGQSSWLHKARLRDNARHWGNNDWQSSDYCFFFFNSCSGATILPWVRRI